MSFIDPTPPGAPAPDVQPSPPPQPDIDPGSTPLEAPDTGPGVGNDNDSRPIDRG